MTKENVVRALKILLKAVLALFAVYYIICNAIAVLICYIDDKQEKRVRNSA